MVEQCLQTVLPPEALLPGEDEDWIKTGLLDSMAHVDVLLCIETRLASPGFFSRMSDGPPTTTRAAAQIVRNFRQSLEVETEASPSPNESGPDGRCGIAGWGFALGSARVASGKIEEEFDLPKGTLKDRAGIDSVCRASASECEISLATAAAQQALEVAGVSAQDLDWIVTTTETLLGFPSLAASLHSTLLATSACRVLDIGGACVGLLNCFVTANALFSDRAVSCIAIASADVHSRLLSPGKVPGEFGGLFGDGASAFVLRRTNEKDDPPLYSVRASIGSCSGTFSSVLRVRPDANAAIVLDFDGQALARAAVERIERIVSDLERSSGVKREAVSAFALHQPNPRLVATLLRRAKLRADRVPLVAKNCGNLGSSTCGVALSTALDVHARKPRGERGPIFAASVGPGLLWTGIVLT